MDGGHCTQIIYKSGTKICAIPLFLARLQPKDIILHIPVIKFISDLQQVGGLLQFPPPIKLTATI